MKNGSDNTGSAKRGRVMFWYDTEDYVSPTAPDAALFHANLLTEFGFRGNFAVVGFYAQRLLERGRYDVIEALKRHVIGSQSLYHSRHPTICEYTDVADWNAGYNRCLAEESECMGMLRATFGLDEINLFVPPGPSVTPTAMYMYSDRGVKFYGGGIDIFGEQQFDRLAWYCNMLHLPYNFSAAATCDAVPDNDVLANRNLSIIYTHPCQLNVQGFWDARNYIKTNCEWRKWEAPLAYPAEVRAKHYQSWHDMMTRIKNDSRLSVIDCDDLRKELKPRNAIMRDDVPALLMAMEKSLEPIEIPASWCVSDIFQAAVAFLRGAESYMPAKAWGFLEKPIGVTEPTVLKRTDVIAAAKALNIDNFIPSQIAVGDKMIGPADFLIAALKLLATDAAEVTVCPRDQIGPISKHLKNLPGLHLTNKGWCIYSDEMKDEYVTNRLRWQFWTLRYE